MVVINEIVYGDALVPGTNDSIELYNAGTETVDLTGWSLHDDKDRPGEADMSGSIAPGEFKVLVEGTDFTLGFGKGDTARLFNGEELVDSYTYEVNANENWSRCPDGTGEFVDVAITTKGQLNACGDPGFGLGGADSVRVFDGDMLVEEYSWTEHADHTYGRCPDMTGDFAQTREATPGERNACDGIPDLLQYYSTGEPPVVVDEAPTFLEDSSGLDYADGFLWAVDNGTGKFWKLVPQADGTVQFADGWEDGKRARFIKDAEGPDVVASAEWHITDLLPEVSANMGIEAIEWIPNAEAKGRLFDENTGEAYDPANYPNAVADGVFVVALEDNGHVYAFSLKEQGEVTPFVAGSNATLLTSYDSFIGGAMGRICYSQHLRGNRGLGNVRVAFWGSEWLRAELLVRDEERLDFRAVNPSEQVRIRCRVWPAVGELALNVGVHAPHMCNHLLHVHFACKCRGHNILCGALQASPRIVLITRMASNSCHC